MTNWSHPSVVRLLEREAVDDPFAWVEQQARRLALSAMEKGWSGPPYDSFKLAEALGIEVVARQDVEDARLVAGQDGAWIEFNPQRSRARIQFSIAHEIGHTLFDDYTEQVRYRDTQQHSAEDWQLEVLCNIAAAEMLMPPGSLRLCEVEDLSVDHLLDQRARLGVSTEALLRRVVRLSERPVALFAAARGDDTPSFRIDYAVPSRAWRAPVAAGDHITDTVLARCTAVGYTDHGRGLWNDENVYVQAVGVPPYPGDTFPRLVGLIQPATPDNIKGRGIQYVRGDAAKPRSDGPAIIAHIVNDQARRWGGHGFARTLKERFPHSQDAYAAWPRSARRLGSVHLTPAKPDLWIASMVAQEGYGPSPEAQPRLRLRALDEALRTLADNALRLRASVHLPLIGTGQGGVTWPKVRDLLLGELAAQDVAVTVYVLPEAPMPDEVAERAG